MSPADSTEGSRLTVRAVVAGALIGSLLAGGNLYLGLKLGFSDSGNLAAVLLGFAATRWVGSLPTSTGMAWGELQNLQTLATTMGLVPITAGLVGAFPALAAMGVSPSPLAMAGWSLAVGGVGILLALPLRDRLIQREQLPFPTGQATALLIQTLHRPGGEAASRLRALLAGGAASAVTVALRDGLGWLPQAVFVPGMLFGFPARTLTVGVAFSPLLVGVGGMIGLRFALSVLLGSGLAWLVLAPALGRTGVLTGELPDVASAWLVWPAVGLMLAAGLASLVGPALARRSSPPAPEAGLAHGWLLSCAGLVCALGYLGFGLSPLVAGAALALTVAFAGVCSRAAGQTDIAPYGPLAQLSQLVLGALLPGAGGAANVLASSVVGGGAARCANSLWSWRAGEDLGCARGPQLRAQLLGTLLGTAVSIPLYRLLERARLLSSSVLPAPSARVSRALAEALARGAASIPPSALWAAGAGACASLLLTALHRRAPWLPAPVAVGVGLLIPFHFAAALVVGAAAFALAARRWPQWSAQSASSAATGALVGEAVVGLGVAALALSNGGGGGA